MFPSSDGVQGRFGFLDGLSPGTRFASTLGMVALIQFISVQLGLALIIPPEGNGTIWPAAGIVLAILLVSERQLWFPILAAVLVGEVAASLTAGYPMLPATVLALLNCVQVGLAALLITRVCGSQIRLDSVHRLASAVLLAAATIAVMAIPAAAIISVSFDANLWREVRLWWVSDTLGVLLGTPLVLSLATMSSPDLRWQRVAEACALFLGLGVSTAIIFGSDNAGSGLLLSLLYVTFPFLIWAALRLGPVGVSTALFLFSVVAVWNTAHGLGPMTFIARDVGEQVVFLQTYLAVAILSSLILAVVTEQRRRTESALRGQTERFQKIFDHIPVMVALHDGKGAIDVVNQEFEQIMGWSRDELSGIDLMAECYPDPTERKEAISHMSSSHSGWRSFKTRVKDGRTLETNWANVRLSDGTSIGIGQDVTQQRELEEQLRHSQKMEAVGRLAGRIAHDFNNLLTVILGYTKLSLDHLEPPGDVRDNLEQTRKATERAAALTQQLLAFSRKQVRQPRVLNLNEVISNMDGMVRRLIGSDVVLSTRTHPELGLIKADPGQIEQGIMNLIVNARDAMPSGGKLLIETANATKDDPALPFPVGLGPGPFIVLRVSDTGCGIDEAVQPRIFEPFFTTKDPGKGTGLGLATVYAMVEQNGGTVQVDSQPGTGTTFRIYLPMLDESVARKARTEASDSRRGSETILVVEDEEMVRRLTCDMLRRSGYRILEAGLPSEALYIVERYEGQIDMVLSDVVMPEMNGRELAGEIAKTRPIGVVYMSGYTDTAIGKAGILPADVHLIQKPFTEAALLSRIRSFLDSQVSVQNARTAGTP